MPRGRSKVLLPSAPGGIREDLNPAALPEGSLLASNNWLTRRGVGTVRPGYELLGALASADRVLGFGARQHTAYTDDFVAHTATKAWAFDGASFADKTGTWSSSTTEQVRMIAYVSGGTTYLLRTNVLNAIDKWDGGGGDFVDATGAGFGRDLCTVAGFVLVVYADGFPFRIRWNTVDDIDDWPAANINEIDSTPGHFIACAPLGPLNAALYKEDSVWLAVSQVAKQPFQFQLVRHVPGPLSPAGLLAYRGHHYWIADDSVIYRFDGAQVSAFATGVPRSFRETLDWPNRLQTHAFVLMEEEPIAFFVYPALGGTIDRAVSVNLSTGAVNTHQFGHQLSASAPYTPQADLTWDDLTGTWDELSVTWDSWNALGASARPSTLLGSDAGDIYKMTTQAEDAGVAIPWSLTHPWKAVGGLGNRFHLDGVMGFWRKVEDSVVVTVGVTLTDTLGDQDAEVASTFDLSTDTPHLRCFPTRRGTFARVRFSAESAVPGIEYRGASVMGWERGMVAAR